MRKILIEGESKIEYEKQINRVNAIHSEIIDLAETKRNLEKKMWDQLRKEFPDQSNNCTLSNESGDLIFIDRLKD
jgi:hypothetical protein